MARLLIKLITRWGLSDTQLSLTYLDINFTVLPPDAFDVGASKYAY